MKENSNSNMYDGVRKCCFLKNLFPKTDPKNIPMAHSSIVAGNKLQNYSYVSLGTLKEVTYAVT
jgi:hypothetical protein